jgi:NAD(P)-dependent dehydrogenase (short-subunit alcohol dehydrogenase family)
VRWCEARIDQRDLAALRARSRDGARDLWPSGHPVRECGYSVIQADFGLGGGRIIVTSSTQGRHGTKYGAAYSASKWGIIGLMKSAVLELGEHNITGSMPSFPASSTRLLLDTGSVTSRPWMISNQNNQPPFWKPKLKRG